MAFIQNSGNIVYFGHVRFPALLGKLSTLQQQTIYTYVLDRQIIFLLRYNRQKTFEEELLIIYMQKYNLAAIFKNSIVI